MYLSASSYPDLDLSGRFDVSRENTLLEQNPLRGGGTGTPQDLSSRIKIIELYALHVLPRNDEYKYSKEFVAMSEFLDDDTREDFLHALQSLEDQRTAEQEREDELVRERDAELDKQRSNVVPHVTEASQLEAKLLPQKQERESIHEHLNSEKDYGIEELTTHKCVRPMEGNKTSRDLARPRSSPSRHISTRSYSEHIYRRSVATLDLLRLLARHLGKSLSHNPATLPRLLLFILVLLVALGRRSTRGILTGSTLFGWKRLRQTMGMGIKVSYI